MLYIYVYIHRNSLKDKCLSSISFVLLMKKDQYKRLSNSFTEQILSPQIDSRMCTLARRILNCMQYITYVVTTVDIYVLILTCV